MDLKLGKTYAVQNSFWEGSDTLTTYNGNTFDLTIIEMGAVSLAAAATTLAALYAF